MARRKVKPSDGQKEAVRRMKAARKDGYTIEEVARTIDVSYSNVWRWTAGGSFPQEIRVPMILDALKEYER